MHVTKSRTCAPPHFPDVPFRRYQRMDLYLGSDKASVVSIHLHLTLQASDAREGAVASNEGKGLNCGLQKLSSAFSVKLLFKHSSAIGHRDI